MKLVTPHDKAATAATRWRVQYLRRGRWSEHMHGQDPRDVTYKRLLELGDTPEPGDVDEVIGNTSWTRTACTECGKSHVPVIRVGEPPDYDSATCWLCRECIQQAMEMIQ